MSRNDKRSRRVLINLAKLKSDVLPDPPILLVSSLSLIRIENNDKDFSVRLNDVELQDKTKKTETI